jgi:hypothetical protein
MIIRTLPTKNGYAQKARSVPSGLKFATLEAYYLCMRDFLVYGCVFVLIKEYSEIYYQ